MRDVAWYAYAGQKLHTYFEKEGIAAKLFRKYPALLKSSADLHQAIMQEQLVPHRAPETEWERQMLRTEVKHYIDTSGLAYSYNEFYTQNMPDKVAWETLQSDLFANLPQIKAERMPQDFSVVLPKLWRKRQAWDAERTKRPPYRGEGSPPRRGERTLGGSGCCRCLLYGGQHWRWLAAGSRA